MVNIEGAYMYDVAVTVGDCCLCSRLSRAVLQRYVALSAVRVERAPKSQK